MDIDDLKTTIDIEDIINKLKLKWAEADYILILNLAQGGSQRARIQLPKYEEALKRARMQLQASAKDPKLSH
jgi:hypothetical protein